MVENSLFTILHLSDFHYTKRRAREQEIVVDALLRDLEKLCVGHRKPDLFMFTGDLVHAAGVDLHDDAYDFLIVRVSKVTGCSDERIFIAPGTHDVARQGLETYLSETEYWRSLVGKTDEMAKIN